MEKQLLQLSPRTRTTDERKKTLDSIQRLVKKEKKKEWLKLASSYAGVAAILFVLLATSLLPTSTTTSAGKDVKYVGVYTYEVNPWYYINGGTFMLNKEGVKNIAQLAALADKGAPFELDPVSHYEFQIIAYYLGTTKDESERYTLLIPYNETETYYFINDEQNTFTSLSHEKYGSIKSSIELNSKEYQDLPYSIRFILVIALYIAYLWLSRRFQSDEIAPLEGNKMVMNTIGKTALMIALLFGLTFILSMLGGDYLNIIVVFIIISIASLLRSIINKWHGYDIQSWLEVPLTIFIYTINFYILFYN